MVSFLSSKKYFLMAYATDDRNKYISLSFHSYCKFTTKTLLRRDHGVIKTWYSTSLFFFFWPCHASCEILVPSPGTEYTPSAERAQSSNHWTTRDFLTCVNFKLSNMPKILALPKVGDPQLECALASPGGLVKSLNSGPRPQRRSGILHL